MTQITILNQSNVPQGPFTRLQLAQKLAAGEFTLESLAHVEGLAQWMPLRDVLARVDASAPSPAVPVPLAVSLAQTPAYSYAATMEPPPHLVYAGFWLRFVAYLIDSLIISVAMSGVLLFFGLCFGLLANLLGMNFGHQRSFSDQETPWMIIFIFVVEFVICGGMIALFWLYFAKLESGPSQATYGKRVLGLRVTDLTGERVSFGRATGRTFGKFVSALPMDIGFIMAGFTDRKQALHDMIAGTLVVRS